VDFVASGRHLDSLPASADFTMWATVPAQPRAVRMTARASLDGRSWRLDGAMGEGNVFRGAGVVALPRTLNGTVEGAFDHPRVLSSLLSIAPLRGRLRFDARMRNLLRTPRIALTFQSDSLMWRGAVADSLAGAVGFSDGALTVDAFGAVVHATLDSVRIPGAEGLRGAAAARVYAQGTLPRITARGAVSIDQPGYGNFAASRLETNFRYAQDSVMIREAKLVLDSIVATAEGVVDIGVPRRGGMLTVALSVNERDAGRVRVDGVWVGDSVALVARVFDLLPGRLFAANVPPALLAGTARLHAVLGKGVCARQAKLDVDLAEFGPLFPDTLRYRGTVSYEAETMSGRVVVTDETSESELVATVNATTMEACLGPGARFANGSTFSVIGERFAFGSLLSAFMPGAVGSGTLGVDALVMMREGAWSLSGWAAARADSLVVPPLELRIGQATVVGVLDGTLGSPSISTYLSGQGIAYREQLTLGLFGHAIVGAREIAVDTLYGGFREGGRFMLSGVFPLRMERLRREGVAANFALRDVPVAAAGPFLPQITIESGALTAEGVARYEPERGLRAEGMVSVVNLMFETAACRQTFGPFTLFADLEGDSVIVRQARGEVNGGVVTVGGYAAVGLDGLRDARMELRVRDVVLDCRPIDRLGIETAALRLAPRNGTLLLSGAVTLGNTRYEQTISLPQLLEGTFIRTPGRRRQPTWFSNVALDVNIDFARNLLVESTVGRFLVDGQVQVLGTLGNIGLTGEIELAEGQINYLDREFEVEEGVLVQREPFELNPRLDISATAEVQSLSLEAEEEEEYTVDLEITGTLRNPVIALSSDPTLGRQQIVNLLTLGSPEGAAGLGGRATELLASQLTGPIARLLEEWLDISNIRVSGNVFGTRGNGGARLSIRENIGARLSVTYETDLTDFSEREIRLLYRLFP